MARLQEIWKEQVARRAKKKAIVLVNGGFTVDAKPYPCGVHCRKKNTARIGLTWGIVIGSYGMPRMVELQLAAIFKTCGAVPILVADDFSPQRDVIEGMCVGNALFWGNRERAGHHAGDLSAFWKGLTWADDYGIRILAKLSQRFIVTKDRWLQDIAKELAESGSPLAGGFFSAGTRPLIRTEAMVLDVKQWLPKKTKLPFRLTGAEHSISDLFAEFGKPIHPWQLVAKIKQAKTDGVLWHLTSPSKEYDKARQGLGLS